MYVVCRKSKNSQDMEKMLMQVWIIGYRGFLHQAIGMFVNDSDEAEL